MNQETFLPRFTTSPTTGVIIQEHTYDNVDNPKLFLVIVDDTSGYRHGFPHIDGYEYRCTHNASYHPAQQYLDMGEKPIVFIKENESQKLPGIQPHHFNFDNGQLIIK